MTSYSKQSGVRWGFLLSVFSGRYPFSYIRFFFSSHLSLALGISHICFVFIRLPLCFSVCLLSICLSHSLSPPVSLFSSSSGPTRAFLLLDPECQFMLVERSAIKVTPLCGDQLGVSVTLESLQLMLQACRPALAWFQLSTPVRAHTHTCTHSPSPSHFTHTHTRTQAHMDYMFSIPSDWTP